MALRSVKSVNQLGMDERVVVDDDLEMALEGREFAKVAQSDARAAFKKAHEQAVAKIGDLADGEVIRVGRFRIAKKYVAPKSVSFETEATSRISISIEDD